MIKNKKTANGILNAEQKFCPILALQPQAFLCVENTHPVFSSLRMNFSEIPVELGNRWMLTPWHNLFANKQLSRHNL